MRKLNAKQKKLLKEAALQYKRENGKLPFSVNDFNYAKVIVPIININPFENSDWEMDRILGDAFFEERNNHGCC